MSMTSCAHGNRPHRDQHDEPSRARASHGVLPFSDNELSHVCGGSGESWQSDVTIHADPSSQAAATGEPEWKYVNVRR